jgi:tetratricopeptide (TPR) repeat protein
MLVTLPCVLLLLDWWPLRRSRPARLVLEKLPLFGLALAVTLVTFVLQERVGAVATLQGLPLELRAANALVSYAGYLGQLFWPRDLGLFYPHPYIEDSGGTPPAPWQIAGAAVLLLGLTGLALRARGRPYLAVGWLWYLCTLAPVIGIVQVGMQAAADRYMYLPSIGLLVAIVWGAGDLFARLRPRLPWPEGLAAAAAATALLALAAGAWQQTRHWRDSLSLFERTLEVSPRNPTIRFNLANHLRDLGRLDDAIREYETALGETRHSADIHVNLANVLRSQGRLDEAAFHYRRTLAIDPEHPLANNGLATVLRAQGNLDEAEAHYRRALRASPGSIAGYNLGNLLRARGRLAEALAVYREALQERPRDARLHNNLAAALDEAGDAEAALRHYAEAVRLAPDYAFAHRNLGALRERRGELEAAIAHFRRAHELAPDDPLARQSLEQALARRDAQPR